MKKEELLYLTRLISENSDETAFDQLMRFYYPPLLSFSNSVLNDRQVAEETIQDIFVKLWENRKTLSTAELHGLILLQKPQIVQILKLTICL